MARTVNVNGSVTVSLAFPIKSEGETLSTLTLRRITGKEWRKLALDKGADTLVMIGELASLAPSSVDQLDGADINECAEAIKSFLQKSPATGDGS